MKKHFEMLRICRIIHAIVLVASILAASAIRAQFSVQLQVTPPTCHGYTNGQITAVPTGGVFPYTFQWSNNQGGATTYGVGAGTYSVSVSDMIGTLVTASISVVAPAPLIAHASPQGDVCERNQGNYIGEGAGGTLPYQFSWSSGDTGRVLVHPEAGLYYLTVTDAGGCSSVAALPVLEPLSVEVRTIDVVCPGWCDGSAEARIRGGRKRYRFLWNTGDTTQVIFPLPPGRFVVTVTDGECGTATAFGDVYEPPAIVQNLQVQGICTGSATASISASGGTPPFQYQWGHGPQSQVLTGLTQGVYFVTVTDANGCKVDTLVTVSDGVTFVLENIQNATCPGVNNGSATATVTQGIGPLSYRWSNGAATPTVQQIGAGNYSVTVTDGAGCTATASVSIGHETTVQLGMSATAAGCAGASLGTATAQVLNGGTPPYAFQWNDVNAQTAPTATGLSPGVYSVIVTDAVGCKASGVVQVMESSALSILAQARKSSCHNAPDGRAEVAQVSANALPPLTYQWSNGATGQMITQLLPGVYHVTVTDAQGCSGAVPVTVGANAAVNAGFSWQIINCPGDTAKVAFFDQTTFSPANNPVVDWQWVFSDGQTADTSHPVILISQSPLTATMMVRNQSGCRDTFSQVIEFQNIFNINLPDFISACVGDTLEISAAPQSHNLFFQWTATPSSLLIYPDHRPTVAVTTTDTLSNGYLYLQVSGFSGCQYRDSVRIRFSPAQIPFDPDQITIAQCEGLTLQFKNNNPFAEFWQWYFNYPDSTATSTLPHIVFTYPDTGNYTLALVSLLNCAQQIITIPLQVAPPPRAAFTADVGPCRDEVTVRFTDRSEVPGDITRWRWNFGNGQVADIPDPAITLDSTQQLIVSLEIDFGTNCTALFRDTIQVFVFEPGTLPDTLVACHPASTISLNPSGNPAFQWEWSPSAGLSDPFSYNPTATVNQTTTYEVLITDTTAQRICTARKKVTILVPDSIGLELAAEVNLCEMGFHTLFPSTQGGTLAYLWSSSADFSDTIGLNAALTVFVDTQSVVWFLKVTDAYGCSQTASIQTRAFPILAEVPPLWNVCKGNRPNISIAPLLPGDSIIWMPYPPNDSIPAESSQFKVVIINNQSCIVQDSVLLNVVDIESSFEITPARDTILQGESVELAVVGNPDLQCKWTPEAGIENPADCRITASPLITTLYKVEVTDPLTGCRSVGQSEICVVSAICGEPMIFVPNAFTPNNDGLNDVLYVRGYNIERVLIFTIYNRWGEKVFESFRQDEGWDGTYKGQPVQGDVFAYFLKVLCKTGQEYFTKGNVTVIR